MLRSVHGDVARPGGGRAVIEHYRNARPARVVRPGFHGRAVQRNGRGLRPAAEREDIPRRALLYDFVSLMRYENAAFVYLNFFRKHRNNFPARPQ